MNQATLRLAVPDADACAAALAPDNDGHLDVHVADHLILEAKATTPMGLLRTLDDALGCLRATGLE